MSALDDILKLEHTIIESNRNAGGLRLRLELVGKQVALLNQRLERAREALQDCSDRIMSMRLQDVVSLDEFKTMKAYQKQSVANKDKAIVERDKALASMQDTTKKINEFEKARSLAEQQLQEFGKVTPFSGV